MTARLPTSAPDTQVNNLSANPPQFSQEVYNLFDKYVHGLIDRRGFLEGASKFAVGGVTAVGLLEALSPKFAEAQQVPTDDKRIKTEYVEFASPNGYGKARGYLVKPAKFTGKLPVVLVVHENRGLNPHIEDIARRLALDNFIAFAPDALFPIGGYPGDEEKAGTLFRTLDQAKTQEDFVSAAAFLKGQTDSNGKLGVVGFCYGGSMANLLATRLPDLLAAVPFYGGPPDVKSVPNIKAKMLINAAEMDDRINMAWPAFEEALKAAGVKYERFQYPGTQHGFNNDTTPRYSAEAAKLAWSRTLALFNSTLRG